ncbi:hypothetical protein ACOMHN_020873 [Nucella lapillus]
MTEVLQEIEGVICYFDDILCHTKTKEAHQKLLDTVKQRLEDAGVKLNDEKCEYFKNKITFLGQIVSAQGVAPDPGKVEAIENMAAPSNIAELRRYLGMINYLGRYLADLSNTLSPLNNLLNKDVAWTWGPEQEKAFQDVKHLITTAPTLAYFDPERPTTVSADASQFGMGGVLMQEHPEGLRPVAFCSRTLTSAEKNYAQIEKECLASVWACERFDRYLVGLETFTLITDHKPLVPLINSKDLSETPLRCQRILMRLMRFKPSAVHVPGKDMVIADTLSQSPLSASENNVLQEDVKAFVQEIVSSWPVSDAKLNQIKGETKKDVNLAMTYEYVVSGWPEHKEDVKLAARNFFSVKNELSVCDELVLRGDRIVIPFTMQKEILERIHDGHLGIVKCRERAQQSVWWPGIAKEIKQIVSMCRECLEKKPTQRSEPLLPSTPPDRPFQRVGIDICELKGAHYLVSIDYYSRYIEISFLPQITSQVVIMKLKDCFARHGIAETVVSDNGRQFTSNEFQKFAAEWNFKHVTSSPHFPQSNGQAESGVKTAKAILKQKDPFLALLTYCSTPIPSLGYSPAELALGRKLRTTLPTHPKTLTPHTVDPETVRERDVAAKQKQKQHHDQHTGSQYLPELRPGDPVLIKCNGEKTWQQPGEVVKKSAPRSYVVKTAGGELRRNRKHLRLRTSKFNSTTDNGNVVPTSTYQFALLPGSRPQAELQPDLQQPPEAEPQPDLQQPPAAVLPDIASPSDTLYTTRSGRAVHKPARF